MNSFLLYIIESTLCVSAFYILGRLIIWKDTDFAINRFFLLSIVVASLIIPFIRIPYFIQTFDTAGHGIMAPIASSNINQFQHQQYFNTNETLTVPTVDKVAPQKSETNAFSMRSFVLYIYLCGVLISIILLIRSIFSVLIIFKKARIEKMNGFRLVVIDLEIPSFTFMKSVVISKSDFESNGTYVLTHELAHVRLYHSYDLIFLEIVKIVFWFNPFIYLLTKDLKQIHEFQADEHTIQSGIDAIQYQLLIIKKSVGSKRFAFANSFNQCQIKKRITMINYPKKRKSLKWKVDWHFLRWLQFLLYRFPHVQ